MDALITTAELADQRGVTPSAISQAVTHGRLRPVRKLPGLRGAFLFDPNNLGDETPDGGDAA